MMGDSSDVNSGELEELAKNVAQVVAKNVSAKMESLVNELQKEKLANQNLSASFAESEEKNEFLKLEMDKVRKENELLKENMQAIHALVPQCKEKVQISDSNKGEDQIPDQMLPGQQAVQTPESLDLNSEESEIDAETLASFRLKKSLEKHNASVHQEKKNKCSKSDASFRFKKSLEKHIASDHEEKKFKCSKSKCDASFSSKKFLKKHIASNHAEKNLDKYPSKKKIEVKGEKVKRLRNSRNQNLSKNKPKYAELNSDEEGIDRIDDESDRTYDDHLVGKTKVSSRGRVINVTPKILNQKNKKGKKKRKSKIKSKVRKEKNIDRVDHESDRIYDDDLVGKKLSCRYDTGWHRGNIEYFNIKLKEYIVFFDDGSHDCIKKDDIDDGVDIILLDWLYRSAKRRSMPKDAVRQDTLMQLYHSRTHFSL